MRKNSDIAKAGKRMAEALQEGLSAEEMIERIKDIKIEMNYNGREVNG